MAAHDTRRSDGQIRDGQASLSPGDILPGLELTIQRQREGLWPVVAELSAGPGELPSRAEGRLTLDLGTLAADALAPQAYGERLGAALFAGAVRDALAAALAVAPSGQVRLLLTIEDAELAALRWERLCGPVGGAWRPLALSRRILFSRYEPSLVDRRFPPIGPQDLRALVLAAAPGELARYQLEAFDAALAASGVAQVLGAIPTTTLSGAAGSAGPPSLDALCRQIVAEAPTVLHLICHGRVLDDGESVLYLARDDDPGRVDPVPASRLIERLANLDGARGLPHLIFLASCASAAPAAAAALGSLAQRLVRELGTPVVVAMADRVSMATAAALAGAFYPRLLQHGFADQALADALAALQGQSDVLVPGLYGRLGGRPLFSDSLARPLTPTEMGAGLERLPALIEARAPVLAPELAAVTRVLRGTLGLETAALSPELRREREAALAQVGAICEEAVELSFAAVALGRPAPPYDPTCPFPGLSAFQADERRFFFGREALARRLAERMAAHPFLAILGPSGSGKSSVVRAGLIPALQARRPGLAATTITPGAHPRRQLREALTADLRGAPPGPRLILVDQLEELFTLCADEEERNGFIAQILGLAGKALVVVTMRADFWGEVALYLRLREAMQAHQELIGPLTPAELRGAIEQQAAAAGLRFEAGLGGQILEDVVGEPGAMPLLQHALAELWKRRRGRWLRGAEYEAIGGVTQAIAHTAEGIYAGLSEAERERLRDSFVRLTRLDPEAGDEARRDTRRRVALADLVPAGGDPAATRELIRRLADARLVVTSVSAGGAQEVEVAHEALIRAWPRLQSWLSEDRQSLRVREAVRQAAIEWDEAGRDESRLVHRGARLDEAAAVAGLARFAPNARERAYLDACLDLRRREREEEEAERQRELKAAQDLAEARAATVRRTRRLAGVVAAVAILAVGAAIFAGFSQRQAQQEKANAIANEQLALQAARRAQAGDLVALAGSAADTPQLGALLTAEALQVTLSAGEPPRPVALEKLYSLLGDLGGEGLAAITQFAGERRHDSATLYPGVSQNAVSPDARYVLTGLNTSPLWLWDVASPATPALTLTLAYAGGGEAAPRFSPDGRWLAELSRDSARVWDLHAAPPAPIPLLDERAAYAAAFSADGATIAILADDGLHVQRPGDGAPVEIGSDPAGAPWALTVSDDGSLVAGLVVDDADGTITVRTWTTQPFARQDDLVLASDPNTIVQNLGFSPNNRYLAAQIVSGDSATALIWDRERGSEWQSLDAATDAPPPVFLSLAFLSDEALIAGGELYTSSGDGWQRQPLDMGGQPTAIAINQARQIGAIGTAEGSIAYIRTQPAPAVIATLSGHEAWVDGIGFSPDGKTMVSVDANGQARRWALTDHGASTQLLLAPGTPVSLAASGPAGSAGLRLRGDEIDVLDLEARSPSPRAYSLADLSPTADLSLRASSADGRRLVLEDEEAGRRVVVELDPGGEARTLRELNELVDLSPDGRWLLTSSYSLDDLDAPAREPAQIAAPDGGNWEWRRFSPDGRWLLVAPSSTNAVLWDLSGEAPQGPQTLRLEGDSTLMAGEFSADGATFAGYDFDRLYVWDIGAGAFDRPVASFALKDLGTRFSPGVPGNYTPALAVSPDGSKLAISAESGAVTVVTIATGEQVTLRGHSQPVGVMTFRGDGEWLASAGDTSVRLWSLGQALPTSIVIRRLGQEVREWDGPALIFRRDGDLVVVEQGKEPHIYSLDPDELIRQACLAAGRNPSPDEWQRTFPDRPYSPTCPEIPAHPDRVDQYLFEALDRAEALSSAEARTAIETALALEPRLFVPPIVWYSLCTSELRTGDLDQALAHCEQAVATPGSSAWEQIQYREARAIARALTGDLDGAAADLRAVADLGEGSSFTDSYGGPAQLRAWADELEAGDNPLKKPEIIDQLLS